LLPLGVMSFTAARLGEGRIHEVDNKILKVNKKKWAVNLLEISISIGKLSPWFICNRPHDHARPVFVPPD